MVHWSSVLEHARKHASKHARRHFLFCDAHVPSGGLVRDGKLLYDLHSFPLRIEEVPENPREGRLRAGFVEAIYGRSREPGKAGMKVNRVWGWDEITWFSQQPEEARNAGLRDAWNWVRENAPAGCLQMPGGPRLAAAADRKRWYYVNRKSELTPEGCGQEDTIREIRAADP